MHTLSIWKTLYWAWVVSEVLVALITRTRRSSGTVQDRGSLLILWPVIFLSITAAFYLGAMLPHTLFGGAPWLLPFSLGLLAIGLALRWTAILNLGRSFSVNVAIHATQTVHKTGLYRFVRHPSYTGLLMILAAIGVATRTWPGLAVAVLPPLAALTYRIHVEEQALRQAFGEEYIEYSRTTRRLIPGIF